MCILLLALFIAYFLLTNLLTPTDEEGWVRLGVEIGDIEPLDNVGVCSRVGKPPGVVCNENVHHYHQT